MAHLVPPVDYVVMESTPEKEKVMDFNIVVQLRRNLKTKMGLCFTKGQIVRVRLSPAEFLNGFQVTSEGYSAVHPLFQDGTNPNVTVFIPKTWVEVLHVA